ncbi:tRNA uracil 4-sulfurtransferase ThiI [Paenibacillus pinihumi]|uniref:tRNA uracil 4-sulfurtransferase ThiI n=1 Tax=Paenibacillus pinihumi TaxID=669462 RepID=UPI0004179295|nr:tRNA uracil 4-sulfurtransferase ThiI [Paenibacillus pinihumi]
MTDYDLVIVRFGEFTLKGRNRSRFEKQMFKQIQTALADYPRIEALQDFGRVYIHLNGEPYKQVCEQLQSVFGIVTMSPVIKCKPELDAIRAAALVAMKVYDSTPRTFKVSARRAWKEFEHNSQAMNNLVGGYVLRAHPWLTVDVRKPEIELRVEIRKESGYVFSEVLPGAGGYPYGTNGKALLLLSGGIDSPVAGWLAMRRGLEIEAVHFHSYPFTSEQARDKVIELARKLSFYSGGIKLHLVPFTEIQTTLAGVKQDQLIITLMRRAMLRITERIAERRGALAIVTGDSLGQVASQTLGSLNVIGRASSLPLLRPLVMTDKQDIVTYAEKLDTYETSILPYEDCCTLFVPKSPSTNPNMRIVENVEASLVDLEKMLDAAVEGTEVLNIHPSQRNTASDAGEDEWF